MVETPKRPLKKKKKDIVPESIIIKCSKCGQEPDPSRAPSLCTNCGSRNRDIVAIDTATIAVKENVSV